MPLRELASMVVSAVRGWEGIDMSPHRFGGKEFRWDRVEIGHVHDQGFVDIPFPRKVRDQLVELNLARRHHILPDSGWVTLPLRSEEELELAIELLKLSWNLKRDRKEGEPQLEAELEARLKRLGLEVSAS